MSRGLLLFWPGLFSLAEFGESVCVCVPGAYGVQKRFPGTGVLSVCELPCRWVLGTDLWVFCKSNNYSSLQSLGSITSGSLSDESEHRGTEREVELRGSPRDGREAKRDMPTLAGFLPLFHSDLLSMTTLFLFRVGLPSSITFQSALVTPTQTHPEMCFPKLPGITQPIQVNIQDLP